MTQTWCKLSNNQRLYLINSTVPYGERDPQPASIVAGRALRRLGLKTNYGPSLTPQGAALSEWARNEGYAERDGGRWVFHEPENSRWQKIDPTHFAELVAAGHYATEIAEKLGVSRQAISIAARRQGLTPARKPTKPVPARPPRVHRPHILSLRVSTDERAAIQKAAAEQGLSVASYLRKVSVDRVTS